MDDLRKRFGRLVAVHRRKAGMTQEQLSAVANISVDMISKIETGATGARFPFIERLAEALKVDAAELFTSELPTTRRNPALSELNIRLSGLDEGELLWVKSIIEAALKPRK